MSIKTSEGLARIETAFDALNGMERAMGLLCTDRTIARWPSERIVLLESALRVLQNVMRERGIMHLPLPDEAPRPQRTSEQQAALERHVAAQCRLDALRGLDCQWVVVCRSDWPKNLGRVGFARTDLGGSHPHRLHVQFTDRLQRNGGVFIEDWARYTSDRLHLAGPGDSRPFMATMQLREKMDLHPQSLGLSRPIRSSEAVAVLLASEPPPFREVRFHENPAWLDAGEVRHAAGVTAATAAFSGGLGRDAVREIYTRSSISTHGTRPPLAVRYPAAHPIHNWGA